MQEPANEGKEREAGDKGGGGKSDEEGDKKSKVGILGPASDACHSLRIVCGTDWRLLRFLFARSTTIVHPS